MKNLTFLSSLTFLFLILLAPACNREKVAEPVTEAVSQYVYAYTSGVISRADPIRIQFSQVAVGENQVGQNAAENILRFTPSIAGTAYWENEQTLVFQPEEFLPANTPYLTTVALDQVFGNVEKEAQQFEFNFHTRELYFDIEIEGLESQDPKDLSKQRVKGSLNASDVMLAEGIPQVLSATQDGRDLPIEWAVGADLTTHLFTISDVARTESEGSISLRWSGKSLGLDLTGQEEYTIPSLSDFKVISAKVIHQPQQYIEVNFSDPLLASMNLNGLIGIQEFDGNFTFSLDGNRLLIYPSKRITGTRDLLLSRDILNSMNRRMPNATRWSLTFEEEKPEVRLVGKGNILPNSEGLIFPFEAINLNAVEVEVFKIFNNNILQFLQNNDYNGRYDLYQVGRVIQQKKVDLRTLNPNASHGWNRYALDLTDLVENDPSAIYQIRIGFRPEYTSYTCENEQPEAQAVSLNLEDRMDADGNFKSIMDGYYGVNGYYQGYEWQHRDDPCYPAYYNSDRFVERNIIASDLGVIAKVGRDKSTRVFVSDLITTNPVNGARVAVYDYQQQLLGEATTDASGMASLELERKPFVLIAQTGPKKGYLKMADGNALNMSRFDIGGDAPQKGIKGYLYGDRGVWRPGDSLYLHFVLKDQTGKLPQDHPITFELIDARGQVMEKRTTSANVDRVYPLHCTTASDAPTGNWRAKVKVGGVEFSKTLKIETVKPNRLKINLEVGENNEITQGAPNANAQLQVNWLHGAPAANVKARVEYQLKNASTTFPKFGDFRFTDPTRSYRGEPSVIFDQALNAKGQGNFQIDLLRSPKVPGKMQLTLKTRAFEAGGDFSSNVQTFSYHPYPAYAGINMPRNKYGSKRIDFDTPTNIEFVVVDTEGNPLPNREVSVGMYRVEWRWWWENYEERLSNFSSNQHYNSQSSATIRTDANGVAKWEVEVDDWGRYLVRICDTEGGHCSGDFFYAGYPWYNNDNTNRDAARMLVFSSEKESYNVGETIQLNIPASADSKLLLTLENGTKVIDGRWEEAKAGENTLRFEATPEMAPTVYAHVELIQPHAQSNNDLPIRMYGVIPIKVEDPATHLEPVVKVAEKLEPETQFEVEVAEGSGKAMAYTIAIVDDGLLDLTNFKTPNPWDKFYAKEALGVKTFDVYDHVLGAYGGDVERLLSVGGDGAEERAADTDKKANRFKPVVLQAGPFYLEKGKKATHNFTMPNYVGSVRAMVVASSETGAYGSAEKTVPVRKPLMVLATLPRVLGPGETVKLPISVFAMEEDIRNVNISVSEKNGRVAFAGARTQTLQFDQTGEKMAYFDVEVRPEVGIAEFEIVAKSGRHEARQTIELDVRNPNPIITNVERYNLKAGDSWKVDVDPLGMEGTNEIVLEVSSMPPMNLEKHLKYLLGYPYGCLEQTLSKAFPQLYVDEVLYMDADQKKVVQKNLEGAINRLRRFQRSDGSFSYWPGSTYSNHWSNSYAGHFLVEASRNGFALPVGMLDRWKKQQSKLAKQWSPQQYQQGYYNYQSSDIGQAYRLYTLALAQAPDLGSMNRLREMENKSPQATWRLAAAYAEVGQTEVAKDLINGLTTDFEEYQEMSGTFGNSTRDRAMVLETLVRMNLEKEATDLMMSLAEKIGKDRWYSTQTLGYSLLAIGKYMEKYKPAQKLQFTYQFAGGRSLEIGSDKPVVRVDLAAEGGSLNLKNTANGLLYVRLIRRGQPLVGDPTAAANNLEIAVNYRDLKGQPIDFTRLEQGTDLVAEVTIRHPNTLYNYTYEEIALDQIFPSGWEILNTRMDGLAYFNNAARPTYEDIRDDRIYSFFNIAPGKSRTFRVRLNASYAGKFYHPSIKCSAMYDEQIYAYQPGQWVEVVSPVLN
jgi:uncharacterized protein YfaS (alpha-2-macroglobulin family)